jgi:hypothetical protein
MSVTHPCPVCRKWFSPDPKVGKRQRFCTAPDCQKERHRRACAKVNQKNAEALKHDRVVKLLVKGSPPTAIDWPRARQEVGVKVAALIEEAGKVVLRRA